MTPAVSVPVAPLSIWHPIHLGTDETGRRVETNLAERSEPAVDLGGRYWDRTSDLLGVN